MFYIIYVKQQKRERSLDADILYRRDDYDGLDIIYSRKRDWFVFLNQTPKSHKEILLVD